MKKSSILAARTLLFFPLFFFVSFLVLFFSSNAFAIQEYPQYQDSASQSKDLAFVFFEKSSFLQTSKDFAPLRAIANFCLPYASQEDFDVPTQTPGLEEFDESIKLALQAKERFEKARATAQPFELSAMLIENGTAILTLSSLLKNAGSKLQILPSSAIGPLSFSGLSVLGIAGAFFLAWELNNCNQNAHQALFYASKAARLGMVEAGKKAREFDWAFGSEKLQSPQTQQAQADLYEIAADLETQNQGGNSLGALASKASSQISDLEEKMRNDARYWPDELPSLLVLLSGAQNSVLSEEMRFSQTAFRAIAFAESEKKLLDTQNQFEMQNAENKLAEFEAQELMEISENAFIFSAQNAPTDSPASYSGTFAQKFAQAQEKISTAKTVYLQAQNFETSKPRGFLAMQINSLYNSKSLLESSQELSAKALSQAQALEQKLSFTLQEKEELLKEKIQSLETQDPAFAIAFTQIFWEFEKQKIPQYPLGKRINGFAEKIMRANEIAGEIESKAPNSQRILRLSALADEVLGLAKKAQEDGLSVEYETALLQETKKALAQFTLLDATNAQTALDFFESRIKNAQYSLFSKAREEYADLPPARKELLEMMPFLEKNEVEILLESQKYFLPTGGLDAKKAIGHLSLLRENFRQMQVRAYFDSSEILQKHLQENLRAFLELSFARLGEETEAELVVSTLNTLSLGNALGKLLEAQVPIEIPLQYDEGSASFGVKAGRNPKTGQALMVIANTSLGQKHFVKIKFKKVFATQRAESVKTIFTSSNTLAKRVEVEFDAHFSQEEAAAIPVLIEKTFFNATRINAESPNKISYNVFLNDDGSKTISALVQAFPGKNKIAFEYEQEILSSGQGQAPFQNNSAPLTQTALQSPQQAQAIYPQYPQHSQANVSLGLAAKPEASQTLPPFMQELEKLANFSQKAFQANASAHALLLQGNAQAAEALAKTSLLQARKEVEQEALESIRNARDACTNNPLVPCTVSLQKTRDAQAALEAKDYGKTFGLAKEAQEEFEKQKNLLLKQTENKTALLLAYENEAKLLAQKTLQEYELAFSFDAFDKKFAGKKSQTPFQSALEQATATRKAMAQLDEWAGMANSTSLAAQKKFSQITLEQIIAQKALLEKSLQQLSQSLIQMRQQAQEELELATQINLQQSSLNQSQSAQVEPVELELEKAQKLLAQGKTFQAYAVAYDVASQARKNLSVQAATGMVSAKAASQENATGLLAAAGIAVIALLAFLFFKSKPQKQADALD